jgi:hypothetical protein
MRFVTVAHAIADLAGHWRTVWESLGGQLR